MFIWFMAFLYAIVNIYIAWRIYQLMIISFPSIHSKGLASTFTGLYLLVAGSPIYGSFVVLGDLQYTLLKVGDWWLSVMIYVGLSLLLFELFLLFKKKVLGRNKGTTFHLAGFIGVVIICATLTAYGGIHAKDTALTSYEAHVSNQTTPSHALRIAFVADLHLGRNVGLEQVNKMVKIVNQVHPDIIIVGGDIFDSDMDAVREPEKIIQALKGLHCQYGIYGVCGNHDVEEKIIAGFSASPKKDAFRDPRMTSFLAAAGITILDDQIVSLDGGNFYLAGRKDGIKAGDGTKNRKSIPQLLSGIDEKAPLIVIEHEPNELAALAQRGADLVLSGHTHGGQMFPITLVTGLFWQNSYGMIEQNGMTSIVTSGVGTYGPPIRVGTNSEVVEITWTY